MKNIFIIAGPTASGKTKLAIDLAEKINGVIVNADSLQVYKENPIISAQPTLDEQRGVHHHLFGYISGKEQYLITRWLSDVENIIKYANKPLVLVGGTGFYLKHLLCGLAEIPEIDIKTKEEARQIHLEKGNEGFHKLLAQIDLDAAKNLAPNDFKRVLRAYEVIKSTGKSILQWQKTVKPPLFPIEQFSMVIIEPYRQELYNKINQRFIQMLEDGVLEEVKDILSLNCDPSKGIMKSHGVTELSLYLKGEISLDEAVAKSQQVVRNYAKRQTTWFKHQFNNLGLRKIVILKPEIKEIAEFVS